MEPVHLKYNLLHPILCVRDGGGRREYIYKIIVKKNYVSKQKFENSQKRHMCLQEQMYGCVVHVMTGRGREGRGRLPMRQGTPYIMFIEIFNEWKNQTPLIEIRTKRQT